METALVGVAIIATAVVFDLVLKARKKGKPIAAMDKSTEKNKQGTELLNELRMKAYL